MGPGESIQVRTWGPTDCITRVGSAKKEREKKKRNIGSDWRHTIYIHIYIHIEKSKLYAGTKRVLLPMNIGPGAMVTIWATARGLCTPLYVYTHTYLTYIYFSFSFYNEILVALA